MQLPRWPMIVILTFVGSGAAPHLAAFSQARAVDILTSLEAQFNAIRTEADPARRDALFEQLNRSVQQNPNLVSEADIELLAKLLSDEDDFIRAIAAGAIGDIGPRAQRTAPQLRQALREIACVPSLGVTSEGPIRVAFKKIGVLPPDVVCPPDSWSRVPSQGPPFKE